MSKKIKIYTIFGVIAVAILSVVIGSLAISNAYAINLDFKSKWVLTAHYNCVKSGVSETTISSVSNQKVVDSMYKNIENSFEANQFLPNFNYFGEVGDGNILGCREFAYALGSDERIDGALRISGTSNPKVTWMTSDEAEDVARKLGYDEGSDTTNITLRLIKKIDGEDPEQNNLTSSGNLIASRQQDGTIKYRLEHDDAGKAIQMKLDEDNNILTVGFTNFSLDYAFIDPNDIGGEIWDAISHGGCAYDTPPDPVKIELNPRNIDTSINMIQGSLNNYKLKGACDVGPLGGWNLYAGLIGHYDTELSIGVDAVKSSYTLGDDKEAAAKRSLERLGLTQGQPLEDLNVIGDEYYKLYIWYLDNLINASGGGAKCHNETGSLTEVHLKSTDGKWYKYYIDTSGFDMDTRTYKTIDNNKHEISLISLREMIGGLNFISPQAEDIPEGATCPAIEGSNKLDQVIEDADKSCFTSAESLGWIVCPIIKGTAKAINQFYTDVVEDLIQIKVSAFDQNDSAYKAWQVFQSLANIIFVILFLVVILSQLTGVGIDNLGIKRILPKLIVAAILVNVSYIICMLLVDVANIAGSGFYRLFDGVELSSQGGVTAGKTAVTSLLSGLGLVAAGGGAVAAIMWVPGMVPAILLGLISILIGILTMFVLLGVYQAGVILAVVVSPVAFVLYMLPNTKSIFDRWRKLFQGLLLLYPICGLVMGGANFASRVLKGVSGDSFWMSLLAALLSVIPVFFIPKILKSSMSAMGNIGNKISGLGKGLSGKATGAISNSEGFKEWKINRAAGRDINGNITRAGMRRRKLAEKDTIRGRATRRAMIRGESAYQKMVDERRNSPEKIEQLHEDKRFREDMDAAKSRNISSGAYENIGQWTGNGFTEGSLAAQLYDKNSTRAEKYAAVSQLMEQKPGHEALRQVFQHLGEEGRMGDIATIARAAKTDSKFGDLKDKNLSTVDYINEVGMGNIESGVTIDSRIGETDLAGISDEDFTKLSKEELHRYAEGVRSGAIAGDNAEALRRHIDNVESNNILRSKVKDVGLTEYKEIRRALDSAGKPLDLKSKNGTAGFATSPTALEHDAQPGEVLNLKGPKGGTPGLATPATPGRDSSTSKGKSNR